MKGIRFCVFKVHKPVTEQSSNYRPLGWQKREYLKHGHVCSLSIDNGQTPRGGGV